MSYQFIQFAETHIVTHDLLFDKNEYYAFLRLFIFSRLLCQFYKTNVSSGLAYQLSSI